VARWHPHGAHPLGCQCQANQLQPFPARCRHTCLDVALLAPSPPQWSAQAARRSAPTKSPCLVRWLASCPLDTCTAGTRRPWQKLGTAALNSWRQSMVPAGGQVQQTARCGATSCQSCVPCRRARGSQGQAAAKAPCSVMRKSCSSWTQTAGGKQCPSMCGTCSWAVEQHHATLTPVL